VSQSRASREHPYVNPRLLWRIAICRPFRPAASGRALGSLFAFPVKGRHTITVTIASPVFGILSTGFSHVPDPIGLFRSCQRFHKAPAWSCLLSVKGDIVSFPLFDAGHPSRDSALPLFACAYGSGMWPGLGTRPSDLPVRSRSALRADVLGCAGRHLTVPKTIRA